MNDEAVLTERRDGVLLITLNRPDARNAVNAALAEGVAAALDELDADDELASASSPARARAFSSGHGPEGLRRRREPVGRRPRLRGHRPARRRRSR